MPRHIDITMTPDEVAAFLRGPHTAVLCTNGTGGIPHAAAVWYVPTPTHLLLATYGTSQKAVNLRRDPRCAVHVEAGADYGALTGVLVRGTAELLTEPDQILGIMREIHRRYHEPRGEAPFGGAVAERYERQSHKRVGVALALDDIASWDHAKTP